MPTTNQLFQFDPEALEPGIRALVKAIEEQPDLPERLARMALTFRKKKERGDGVLLAREARRMSPDDPLIQVLTDWVVRRHVPLWHFPLVHDELRNQAYAEALERFVKPGMTVLEIGTGTGLLAMLAARAGAKHVYTCEAEPPVAEAARAVIAHNGLADRITVIAKNATELRIGTDLPERADLFVAEIVDNGLLGEGVLSLTEHARAHLLKDEAVLLPHTISAVGMLVSGAGYRKSYRMGEVMGFDLSPFNRFSPPTVGTVTGGGRADALSGCCELLRLDLTRDHPKMREAQTVTLTADRDGIADGVLRWLRLDFGGGICFENRPPQESAWFPQLHLFREPRPVVRQGEPVALSVQHDRKRVFIQERFL